MTEGQHDGVTASRSIQARPRIGPWQGIAITGGFLAATLAALVVAATAAMPLSVLGLAVFGLAHVALELRYVVGRFSARISQVLGMALFLTLTLVVLARGIGMVAPQFARPFEIVAGAIVVSVGVGVAVPRQWRTPAFAGVAAILVASLWQPGWYFYGLTHLHNLIPLVFLWDWAVRRLGGNRERAAFLGVQVLWVAVLPAVILAGAIDPFLSASPGVVAGWVGDGSGMLAASAPPGDTELQAERHLVVFAMQQTMHYVVWIGFFPLFGRDASRSFDVRFPALREFRVPLAAAAVSAILLVVFTFDYVTGRMLYSIGAAYHVYLEFPVILMMMAGAGELGLHRGEAHAQAASVAAPALALPADTLHP